MITFTGVFPQMKAAHKLAPPSENGEQLFRTMCKVQGSFSAVYGYNLGCQELNWGWPIESKSFSPLTILSDFEKMNFFYFIHTAVIISNNMVLLSAMIPKKLANPVNLGSCHGNSNLHSVAQKHKKNSRTGDWHLKSRAVVGSWINSLDGNWCLLLVELV